MISTLKLLLILLLQKIFLIVILRVMAVAVQQKVLLNPSLPKCILHNKTGRHAQINAKKLSIQINMLCGMILLMCSSYPAAVVKKLFFLLVLEMAAAL